MGFPKNNLKELTREYWFKTWDEEDESRPQWYVRELLRHELAYKQYLPRELTSDPKESAKAKKKCDILVIMLGHSIEPLLQAIVAYQPSQVLMVLNKKYDDERDGEVGGVRYFENRFESAIQQLRDNHLLVDTLTILPEPMIEAGGSPVEIFRFLRKMLLAPINEGKRVVIDITAAKKSMVAGAYLFAAFADVPVSYVDFETYDPVKRRPFGYTCIIEEIESPTEAFRLRDWTLLRELYQHFAFRTSRELLTGALIPAMKMRLAGDDQGLFEAAEIAAAQRLVKALRVFQLWDEGDFGGAYTASLDSDLAHLPLPTAIHTLGKDNYWPKGLTVQELLTKVGGLEIGNGGDINSSLYIQHEKLLTYALDELAKIGRLRDNSEESRSALLRAAGLSELLFTARLVRLWVADSLFLFGLARSATPKKADGDRNLPKASGIWSILKCLNGEKTTIKAFNSGTIVRLELELRRDAPRLTKFWSDDFDPYALADLRNTAIHFCIPVSADLAKQES